MPLDKCQTTYLCSRRSCRRDDLTTGTSSILPSVRGVNSLVPSETASLSVKTMPMMIWMRAGSGTVSTSKANAGNNFNEIVLTVLLKVQDLSVFYIPATRNGCHKVCIVLHFPP